VRFLLCALGLLWCVSAAAAPADLAAVIDPLVAAEMKSTGAPGAGVVAVHRGRVLFLKAYGLADVEANRAATAETLWPIASTTKLLTAIAVTREVEAGRIRLDADIGIYLKQLTVPAAFGRPITLADALRHTSGLDELPGRQVDDPAKIPRLQEFLTGRLVRWRAPGGYPAYSTYGIALAAAALEDVSGESYAGYMASHVFAPLGMTSARIMLRRADTQGVATPYALDDAKATRMAYEWYATPPASSAALSLNDMAKLLLDLTAENPRVLGRSARDDMMRQQSSIHPDVPGWGYGFQLDRLNGRRIAEHGGDIGGFAGLLSVLPDEGFAIYVVNHGEGSSLRFRVRDAAIKALFPAAPIAAAPPRVAADPAPFLGTYRAAYQCHTCAEPGNAPTFEIKADNAGNLMLWGSTWIPIGGDVFFNAEGGRRIAFLRDASGKVTVVGGSAWRVGERVTK
jgi:CubicO group peptidase (beta-lactamase class C family)